MRILCNLLLASTITFVTIANVWASSLMVRVGPQEKAFVLAQYDGGLCANWQQQCARYYGGGTQQWHQCMNQPQARYDCGAGGGYGGYSGYRGGYGPRGGYGHSQGADACDNWHDQCARLYGWRTYNYRACMHQPQALADCGRY